MDQRDDSAVGTGFKELIDEKIEKLRPRLLDLSRRNSLISTPLDSRHGSYIRVVDELPDVLLFRLSKGEFFGFHALPDFDDEPPDEQTEEFRQALTLAMSSDEDYADAIEDIDPGDVDAPGKELAAERALRDRVRKDLGLPDRGNRENPKLQEHAKSHNISPFYDLPTQLEEHADGRHTDDAIQTLLLPDVMERTLNRVRTRCRTFQQETGINVMQGAFAYLEWTDPDSGQQFFSPLILVPVILTKQNSSRGTFFKVGGTGEEATLNTVLAEKLRRDFGIELPVYDGGSVEAYLPQVEAGIPARLKPRLRRFVTFGAFPSVQLAMYHDLDTTKRDFSANRVIHQVLAGSDVSDLSNPFATEYDVDTPAIESSVPLVVTDADSSQFSVLADVAQGRDLAVEGPPGTGKSQTIVNTIALAMLQGKKVLFVAEKTAALNVVWSRLQAIGLGEFVLPLLAETSSRQQVLDSVRERMDMRIVDGPDNQDQKVDQFRRTRRQLSDYLELMSSELLQTGLTVREVIGKAIATEDALDGLDLPEVGSENTAGYDPTRIAEVLSTTDQLVVADQQTVASSSSWKGVQMSMADRFSVDDALRLAREAAHLCKSAASLRDTVVGLGAPAQPGAADMEWIAQTLTSLIEVDRVDVNLAVRLVREKRTNLLRETLARCEAARNARSALATTVEGEPGADLSAQLRRVHRLCVAAGMDTLDRSDLAAQRDRLATALDAGEQALKRRDALGGESPDLTDADLSVLAVAAELVRNTPRSALLVRTAAMTDPRASQQLDEGVKELRRLQHRRRELEELFKLDDLTDSSGLVADARTLRRAGSLAIFSGQFRAAKRRWQQLAKPGHTFDKPSAADELSKLADWRDDVDRFARDQRLINLLGDEFRGIDTDVDNLAAVAAFVSETETRFAALELRSLRNVLLASPLDVLTSLAELHTEGYGCAYRELETELDDRRGELQAWDDGITAVAELDSRLKDYEQWAPERLTELADTLDAYLDSVRLVLADPLRDVLGERWRGIDLEASDVAPELEFARIVEQREGYTEFFVGLSEKGRLSEVRDLTRDDDAPAAEETIKRLADLTILPVELLGIGESYTDRAERFTRMADDRTGLVKHAELHIRTEKVRNLGFGAELDAVSRKFGDLTVLPKVVEARIFRSLARLVHWQHSALLAEFKDVGLDNLRERLAKLDRQIISGAAGVARQVIHNAANPPHGIGVGRKADYTELSLLNHEISKIKRHIPVRDLTRRAGRALAELKPCWMMSPLAVARHLDHNDIDFDLCVIDEASQMPPEHAIGALSRARQAMVVGDTNQLPPSNFFRKMVADEDDDEEEVVEESILELANGAFRPSRRLRWHYRSRNAQLIAFSNHAVYDDDLIVFPSAVEHQPDMGVSLKQVEGVYRSGTNVIEATAVVEAVVSFMKRYPDRSLGVVTLNQKQRDLVQEKIDHALNKDAKAREYVEKWENDGDGLESFFVKNLENVQGDERDVIFIGTVYGPDAKSGRVYQRFGPINGVAGRRRLNVLFSRAKEQIVTFSSMTAADINAEADGNPGAYMLKRWLEYSKTGRIESGTASGRGPGSPFEEHVAQQIRSMGCEPVPQVGVNGYFIDIGVKHPKWPHGYLLGVECDGANYHSAKSARDRDRLRQETLERLGWRLHRVWSTNWFDDPAAEAAKIREAIKRRLSEVAGTGNADTLPRPEPEIPVQSEPRPEPKQSAVPTRPQPEPETSQKVKIGVRVRVRYLDGQRDTIEGVVVSKVGAGEGRIAATSPLGQAILGLEVGDVAPLLIGTQLRRVEVETIDAAA